MKINQYNLFKACFGGNQVNILIFHRVLPEPGEYSGILALDDFKNIVKHLSRLFHIYTLSEACEKLKNEQIPPRSLVITFDDGYADNYLYALPVLKQFGVPATFFVATDFIGGETMWNDKIRHAVLNSPLTEPDYSALIPFKLDLAMNKTLPASIKDRRALGVGLSGKAKYMQLKQRDEFVEAVLNVFKGDVPDNLMMSVEQLVSLKNQGMEIGAHTASHPILAKLSEAESRDNIVRGKECLENWLRAPITSFAYPNGKPIVDYKRRDRDILEELGFDCAVSTVKGVARSNCDMLQLPRFTPWNRNVYRFMLSLLLNSCQESYQTA